MEGIDKSPMRRALTLAAAAADAGEVPVGAVIMHGNQVVAAAANSMRSTCDPTAHAEIVAIRSAALSLGTERLIGCSLWVTLEPCAMCAGAISHARLDRLYYAASDPKGGAIAHGSRIFSQPTCHHKPDVYAGICESEATLQLRQFFNSLR